MLGVVLGVDVAVGDTVMLGDGDTECVGVGLAVGTDDVDGETEVEVDGVLEIETVGVTD